jgi:hypothetical protein
MRTLLLLLLSVFVLSTAYAQEGDTRKRWLLEAPSYLVLSSPKSGESYTDARLGQGAALRMLYQQPIGKRIRLAGGLGLAMQQVR